MAKQLRLFTSNRLEILADALTEALRIPLSSPLDKEVIVVQSKGMERWICLQLAERQGICANCRFPFPNTFVHEVFQKILKDVPAESLFHPEVMTWRVMKCLPSLLGNPEFESLKIYLGEDCQQLKLFQLSARIADLFDQYLLFRPEMIRRWESRVENHWQAILWKELVKGTKANHRAALAQAFFDEVAGSASVNREGLPERVSVFGISALPPFYVQVLAALTEFFQVNLFLMNPCVEYWGDILSAREMEKGSRKGKRAKRGREELHLEKGNSLLASMGILGRDFLETIYELEYEEHVAFKDPGDGTLLTTIQHDIMHLIDGQEKGVEKKLMDPDDRSIQIHSCHSPMREVEVLRDRLLHMFGKDSTLLPKDILVMMPDIETYAPYIQAVFDLPEEDPTRIPFSMADRSIKGESGMGEALLSLLDLHGSRFVVSQVLNLLEVDAVRRRFGLAEEDMELIRTWVRETKIRWGVDAQTRAEMGLPFFPENTWRAGIERLLLGYALPGQDERVFKGILPYDHMEGEETRVLGAFSQFLEVLFHHVSLLSQSRTLKEWQKELLQIVEKFILPDRGGEKELQAIRGIIEDMGRAQEMAEFHEVLGVQVIKDLLNSALASKGFGFGFITGRVTFCAMLPMRSIPFRVICLLGMHSDAYPRESRSLGFDLISKHPRRGDRSRRNDDRYLFLEAILSARESLYISYAGQSLENNKPIPPSVVVSELMDYMEEGFEVIEGNTLDRVLTRHRLQAFNPQYFRNPVELQSFSEENYRVASSLMESREEPLPFISEGLSEPEETWQRVELEDLCSFYFNPAKFLLNRRLGIRLEERATIPEERESFELSGLERYLLEERLLRRSLRGDPRDDWEAVKAAGSLPSGVPGECVFENLRAGIQRFEKKLSPLIQRATPEPLTLDFEVTGFRVSGRMDGLTPEGVIRYRYASIKPRDHLKAWIYHLALNCLTEAGHPKSTLLAGLTEGKGLDREWLAVEYGPLEEAEEVLENLLRIYWSGLRKPLPFFPKTSWSYAEAIHRGQRSPDALAKARRTWESSEHVLGEDADHYYQLCFRHRDPLDSDFEEISLHVFAPLLKGVAKR